jgi:hypothetical protein
MLLHMTINSIPKWQSPNVQGLKFLLVTFADVPLIRASQYGKIQSHCKRELHGMNTRSDLLCMVMEQFTTGD